MKNDEKRSWAEILREQYGVHPDLVTFAEAELSKDPRQFVTPHRMLEALLRERPDLASALGYVGMNVVLDSLADEKGGPRFVKLRPT